MCCFNAEDTIFVLNKWDTIEDDEEKDEFFESAKTKLCTLWKEIDEKHILKLAAVKVSMHVHTSMRKCLVHVIEHFFYACYDQLLLRKKKSHAHSDQWNI